MKIISNLHQKILKWSCVAFLAIMVLSFNSCNKDEPKEKEDITENIIIDTENRTGGHVNIFTDSTAVFFNTDPSDTSQSLVNLRNVDSISYVSPPPYKDINYNGTYCWEYDITFYSGTDNFTRRSFAKYRGTNYKQYPGAQEGHNNDQFFEDLIRLPVTMQYFDYGCTKDKLMHMYTKVIRKDGQFFYKREYIPSGNCNTQVVQLRKLFKK